jgi:hypothetical protein
MQYSVKNKSENDIKLLVPYYHANYMEDSSRIVSQMIDSIWVIQTKETVMLDAVRVLYPSHRSFYRSNPGVCGIRRIEDDTIVDLGCSKKEWKYRKGKSMLILK